MAKTLYDKLWDMHVVSEREDGTALIYIDRQILHEVTSPQAFEGLRLAVVNRGAWIPILQRQTTTYPPLPKSVPRVLRVSRMRPRAFR